MPASGDRVLASDVDDLEDYTTGKPLVRLVQQSAQSIPDATLTALTFGASSEDIDTHGLHDTSSNTSRITITTATAGYWRFYGVYFTGTMTTPVSIDASFRKNGSGSIASGMRNIPSSGTAQSATASCLQLMAAGDYMELLAFQDSSGAVNTNISGRFTSVFEAEFLRPA